MKLISFIFLSCYMHMSLCMNFFSFSTIEPGAQVHETAQLGRFITIGTGAIINAYVKIEDFTKIGRYTSIGGNSRIAGFANIGERCLIENDVNINNYAKIGNYNTFGAGSVFYGYVSTGNNVKCDNQVQVNAFVAIGDDAQISEFCMIDQYARIGAGSKLYPSAFVGSHSSVLPGVTVGESAVLHTFVEIQSGGIVKPKEVVIRMPTSYNLYQSCDSIDQIPAEQVNIATNGDDSAFNNLLRSLIETQFDILRTNCQQTQQSAGPAGLRTIISLFLLRIHGAEEFKNNLKHLSNPSANAMVINQYNIGGNSITSVNGVITQINGQGCSPSVMTRQRLAQELPFIKNPRPNVLQPDVLQKLTQLLAMEQDAAREHRIANDNFCKMIAEILSGERDVTMAIPTMSNSNIIC